MALITEPVRKSILDVVQHNLRAAGLVSIALISRVALMSAKMRKFAGNAGDFAGDSQLEARFLIFPRSARSLFTQQMRVNFLFRKLTLRELFTSADIMEARKFCGRWVLT